MSPLKLIRYGAWVSVAALGLIIAAVLLSPPKKPGEAGAGRIGGPFQLAQASGGTLDSASLRGEPYGVFFGFTQCPDICPGTLTDVTALMDDLDKGPLKERAAKFRVLFVTVDPERDTAEVLKSYLSAFDGRIAGLVPTMEQLPALARQFAAFYEKVPTSSGYTMNHTASVYLFNRDGQFAGTIDIKDTRSNQLAKLERLIRG
jgi:protein SCO1/2